MNLSRLCASSIMLGKYLHYLLKTETEGCEDFTIMEKAYLQAVRLIIYLIAYANILTVRTYVLKTRTYNKMQTEIFKVGPNYL